MRYPFVLITPVEVTERSVYAISRVSVIVVDTVTAPSVPFPYDVGMRDDGNVVTNTSSPLASTVMTVLGVRFFLVIGFKDIITRSSVIVHEEIEARGR
jgi:hypothetical protein